MADTPAILSSDKSTAPAAALSLLCALVAVQLTIGACGLWMNHGTSGAKVVAPASGPAASSVVLPSVPGAPLVIPPMPVFTNPMPSAVNISQAIGFSNPLPPAASSGPGYQPPRSVASPGPALGTLPAAPLAPSPSDAPAAPSVSQKTGNVEADELLDVAAQSLDLGDESGAMQALNRADLLLPNNPVITRAKALAMQRQGLSPQQDQAPAPAVPSPVSRPTGPSGLGGAPPAVGRPSSPGETLNRSFGTNPAAAVAPPAVRPSGPLSLGPCEIVRDSSVVRGDRFALKVPLIAAPGEIIDPNQMILDVMFYDKVNNDSIELTMADKPRSSYDTAGDFRTGKEVISVLYNLPEFTPAQIAELGRHVFYGYVVKLYYKNRLVGATANPPDLGTLGDSGNSPRGAAPAVGLGKRN